MQTLKISSLIFAGLVAVASGAQASSVHSNGSGLGGTNGQGSNPGTGNPAPAPASEPSDDHGAWVSSFKPDGFGGDLSVYLGGTISFDAKTKKPKTPSLGDDVLRGKVVFKGADGSATLFLNGVDSSDKGERWRSYSAKLESSDLTLAAILHSISDLDVSVEFANGITQTAKYENFTMAPVPIPGTAWLMMGGLAVLAGTMRYQKAAARPVALKAHA